MKTKPKTTAQDIRATLAGDAKRIPTARRARAAAIVETAKRHARQIVESLPEYSGYTSRRVRWGDAPGAETSTTKGGQYSRACTWRKTDACHTVTLAPDAVAELHDYLEIVAASERDGLPLVGLYPPDRAGVRRAVWVETRFKQAHAVTGWIAASLDGATLYHSTTGAVNAHAGLARKLRLAAKEAEEARKARKTARRARLVARLCNGAVATVADARAMGYCGPGIAAFQSRFGIGDAAPLPELVKTGNPMAVALALKLARAV
jgi:hypothetical protein